MAPKRVQDIPDMKGLQDFGTASVLNYQNMSGGLPTRNYTSGTFEQAEDMSGETMAETILKQNDTCYACVVRCKRVVETEYKNNHFDPLYGGPEYETLGTHWAPIVGLVISMPFPSPTRSVTSMVWIPSPAEQPSLSPWIALNMVT